MKRDCELLLEQRRELVELGFLVILRKLRCYIYLFILARLEFINGRRIASVLYILLSNETFKPLPTKLKRRCICFPRPQLLQTHNKKKYSVFLQISGNM